MDESEEREIQNQKESVNRDDAKVAPDVEDLEVISRIAGIDENPTDEEPRQNKKQIHASPGEPTEREEIGKGGAYSRVEAHEEVMVNENHGDGDAADAVEFEDATLEIESWCGHGRFTAGSDFSAATK